METADKRLVVSADDEQHFSSVLFICVMNIVDYDDRCIHSGLVAKWIISPAEDNALSFL